MQADSSLVTYVYEAAAYGGSHNPNINVLHSIESPLKRGYARTLTGPAYFGGSSAGVSSHYVVDPVDICQGVPESRIAYHVGRGNPRTIATEQSGYARFSRTDWTTSDGLAQLDNIARLWADISTRRPLIQLRWLTDEELRYAWNNPGSPGGCSYHQQFMRVIGGTTHHDPCQADSGMADYPFDLLMERARTYKGGGVVAPETPTTPPELLEDEDEMRLDVVRCDGIDYAFNAASGVFFKVRDPDHYGFLLSAEIIKVEHNRARGVESNLLEFIRQECARAAGLANDQERVEGYARPAVLTGQTPFEALAQTRNDMTAVKGKVVDGGTVTPPAGPPTYTVVAGDTLGAIAKKFGVTVEDLVTWNGITDPNNIAVGQVLAVGKG